MSQGETTQNKVSIFHHLEMNTFANILEYFNPAPVSDTGRSSYTKIRRKNTWTGRVSLIKKML